MAKQYFANTPAREQAELGLTRLTRLFVAGTIDLGVSRNWQAEVFEALRDIPNLAVCNPRTPGWDCNTPLDPNNEVFARQVEWEQRNLYRANIILFNFEPNSKSPVSMLELGQALEKSDWSGVQVHVVCPPEFWRYANIVLTCRRYGVAVYDTIDQAISAIQKRISQNS